MIDFPFVFITSTLCMLVIILAFRFNKLVALIHAIVFTGYSVYLYYTLFYDSKSGEALVWWFLLVMLSLLHFVILGVYLLLNHGNQRKDKK